MNIRINADDQSSCKILMYCLIIVVAIILVAVLVAYAIPSSIIKVDQKKQLMGSNLAGCNSNLVMMDSVLMCGDGKNRLKMGQYVNNLGRLNQVLVFYLSMDSYSKQRVYKQKIYFRLYSSFRTSTGGGEVILNTQNLLKQKQLELSSSDYYDSHFYLDFMNKIGEDDLYWQIEFRLGSILQFSNKIELQSTTINPQYSVFCIVLRVVFLVIACVTFFCGGLKYYRAYKGRRIIPEQIFIVYLSVLTMSFNDPFYVITILFPNPYTSIMSTLFLWNFVTIFFIIWVFFLQRIHLQQYTFETKLFDKSNIAMALVFYIVTLIYRIGQSIYQTYDRPFIDPNYTRNTYLTIAFVLSTIVFGLAVMYVLYLYCNICGDGQRYQWRNRTFIYISFFFFFVIVGLFISGSYNVFQYSAIKVMVTVTFTNIYSFYLQYLYSPVRLAQEQDQQTNGKEGSSKQTSIIAFQNQDIYVDLQKDPFQDLTSYGENMGQEGELCKPTKSYLGQYLTEGASKIKSQMKEQKPSE